MAQWLVVRRLDRVLLFYDNLVTGLRYDLGARDLTTTDAEAVAWIFAHGGPQPGDRIRLPDGALLVYSSAPAAAA